MNVKTTLLVTVALAAALPLVAREILVAGDEVAVYEEGGESPATGKRLWRWSAESDKTIPAAAKKHFASYTDVKALAGGTAFAVAGSAGGWAIVDRAKNRARLWGVCGERAHSVEVLPDGLVAVAAETDGGREYVYLVDTAKAKGSSCVRSRTAKELFDKPRGLHWDEGKSLLWVLDASALTACKVVRDGADAVSLERVKLVSLVDQKLSYGCDLRARPSETNEFLYATTRGRVYPYDTKKGAWPHHRNAYTFKNLDSFDITADGKILMTRRKEGRPADLIETRDRRRIVPYKKTGGGAIYRVRWMPEAK